MLRLRRDTHAGGFSFDVSDSGDSSEPNGLQLSNQCHHLSCSRSLCYWTWFTGTEQFSEKYVKINFRRMAVLKVEDICKSCWKTLQAVYPFHFKGTCYKTTLLSRFKLPSTDKLSRWKSTKWKRVETTTFDATRGSASSSNKNTPENLFRTCFIHQKVLWQHSAKVRLVINPRRRFSLMTRGRRHLFTLPNSFSTQPQAQSQQESNLWTFIKSEMIQSVNQPRLGYASINPSEDNRKDIQRFPFHSISSRMSVGPFFGAVCHSTAKGCGKCVEAWSRIYNFCEILNWAWNNLWASTKTFGGVCVRWRRRLHELLRWDYLDSIRCDH